MAIRRSLLLALLATVWLCCSCAGPRLPIAMAQRPPLVLGAVYPLSGPQGAGGKEELAGVQTAVALLNAAGGIGGRRVTLVVKDAPDAAAGVAAVDDLAQHEHVPAILGSYSSVIAVAASAEANRLRTIWWETGAVADDVTTRHLPYVFRTVATGSTLGRMSARFTQEVLLPAWHATPAGTRVVVVYERDVYGQSVAAGAVDEAKARGLDVVDQIPYDAGNVDPGAIARRLVADRADVLWDASYLDDGLAIWRAIVASGLHLKGAIGTSSAFCLPAFGQQLGPLATGLFASDKPDGTINAAALDPAARTLLARAQAAYRQREGQAMGISALAGFVGAWALLHDVVPTAKATTAEGIRAAALAVDLPYGSEANGAGLRFAPPEAADGGQNERAASVVWQWQRGNETVVYPAPYRDSAPLIAEVPA